MVKSAWVALKAKAVHLLGDDVEKLAENPDSQGRAAVLVEEVEARPAGEQAELRELAEAVTQALEAAGQGEALTQMVNTFNNYGSGSQYNAPGGTQHIGAIKTSEP